MVVNSGVYFSLHAKCNQQIIFGKLDLKIYYPPPTNGKYRITNRLMPFLLDGQFMSLIGKKLCEI